MTRKPAFISHSREREAEIQGRMLDVLERRFRRKIRTAIIDESQELMNVYKEAGYIPPPSDDATARFRNVYREMAIASAKTFGARVMTAGKAAGHVLETKQIDLLEFFMSLANAWINYEAIRRRIQSVTETTREQIVAIIARGQENQLTRREIVAELTEQIPQLALKRSIVIARTETHGAANFAAHETAKRTGLELTKEWVSVHDHRTRSIMKGDQFDHWAMDGQKREMDEPFSMPWIVGGNILCQYPGDPALPAGAVINCRCAVIHAVKA